MWARLNGIGNAWKAAPALFLMADGCDWLTGQTIALDGAGYLANGASFTHLANLSDQDWQDIRDKIKSANDQDKANRST